MSFEERIEDWMSEPNQPFDIPCTIQRMEKNISSIKEVLW